MYKLAIVDDEALSRKLILKMLDPALFEIDSILEAKSSRDALECFKTFVPDIMLVDIRMPGIDGLSLIKLVQENINPSIKSIVFSGYDDFTYCKQAINLKVYDYLLKPVKKAELDKAMQNVINDLKFRNNASLIEQQARDIISNTQYISLIDGKSFNRNLIIQQIKKLEADNSYLSIVVKILKYPFEYNNMENSLGAYIKSICSGNLPSDCPNICFMRNPDECVILINTPNNIISEKIVGNVSNILIRSGFTHTIGTGSRQHSLEGLKASYIHALKASKEYLLQGPDRIYNYSFIDNSNPYFKSLQFKAQEKQVIDYISIGSPNYQPLLASLLGKGFYASYMEWESALNGLIYSIQGILNENNDRGDLNEIIENAKESAGSIKDIIDCLLININDLIKQITYKQANKSCSSIYKTIDYIESHYTEHISLKTLSTMIYMNPTYFCEIFKKTTGKTFIEYLTCIRMKKAKEFLANSTLKIHDIAEKVGYNNVNQFIKVFKKDSGFEPKKYRESYKESQTDYFGDAW